MGGGINCNILGDFEKKDNKLLGIEHSRNIHTFGGKNLERRKTNEDEEDKMGEEWNRLKRQQNRTDNGQELKWEVDQSGK